MKRIACPRCKSKRGFDHIHNSANEIYDSFVSGTERFVCRSCGREIYYTEGIELGFNFPLEN